MIDVVKPLDQEVIGFVDVRIQTSPRLKKSPRNFAISPENKFVLVANQNSGEITVLPVLPGTLGEPVTRLAVPGVSFITFAK